MSRFSILVVLVLYLSPTILFFPYYPFQATQLFAVCLAFFLGVFVKYIFGPKGKKNVADYSDRFSVNPRTFYLVVLSYFVLNNSSIINLVQSIISGNYIEFVVANNVQRYEDPSGNNLGIASQISLILFLMTGSLAAAARRHKTLIHALLFCMIVIQSASLARLSVLFVFVTYIIEIVISRNYLFETQSVGRYLKIAGVIVPSLLLIYFFSAYMRVVNSDNPIEIAFMKLGSYTIAIYEALMIWMRDSSDSYGTTSGSMSFSSLFKLAGITFPQGFYQLVDTRFGSTNVYTSIRGLLSDFGLMVTCCFFFIQGYVIRLFAYNPLSGLSYQLTRILLFMLMFTLISPFVYFNITLAFILSGLIISGVTIGRFSFSG